MDGSKDRSDSKTGIRDGAGNIFPLFFAIFNLFLYLQRRTRNGGQSGREKKKQGAASLLEKLRYIHIQIPGNGCQFRGVHIREVLFQFIIPLFCDIIPQIEIIIAAIETINEMDSELNILSHVKYSYIFTV